LVDALVNPRDRSARQQDTQTDLLKHLEPQRLAEGPVRILITRAIQMRRNQRRLRLLSILAVVVHHSRLLAAVAG
jgi:hypothetical protein